MRNYSGRLVALLTRLTAFNYLRPLFGRPLFGVRVVCEQCHAERLLGFSCNKRGFCPSCGAAP